MDRFIRELEIGEIYQRDNWQFELKSEFIPNENPGKCLYTQEFYFFIPNSLQINEETYPKTQFYEDQINLIRYKTPEFELEELCDEKNKKSPLNKLGALCHTEPSREAFIIVEDELKLLGNILRSSIRERVAKIIVKIEAAPSSSIEEKLYADIEEVCKMLDVFRARYLSIQSEFMKKWTSITHQSYFLYIDEFLSETIDYYLVGLLSYLQKSNLHSRKTLIKIVSDVILKEKQYREQILKTLPISENDTVKNEYILYTRGLLNKFVIDALLLTTKRSSVAKRFQNLIGSIAAAIAMLFFFVLFSKQSSILIINSLPFILITVFLYVLKDRIKESLKNLSYTQFAKWFSDYKTEIHSPEGGRVVGRMREYVSFIHMSELSDDIKRIRHKEFHVVLETFKRPEHVLYYKKVIKIYLRKKSEHLRRRALNVLFRFNVGHFLEKADNPSHEFFTLDPDTLKLHQISIPKVYHVNVIMKNTYYKRDGEKAIELKKFRLVLDKNGIKRVEHVSH